MSGKDLYIPYIPKMPDQIGEHENLKQCITNRVRGEWKFLFREIKDIPSPYAKDQDYDFDTINDTEWQEVIAPSSLIMQGFDIENNTEYYYKRTLKLPERNGSEKFILRFEGVYSNARVWVNNRYIKTHIGGFTHWDCDITAFADQKEITLIIGVTDAEGSKKGIWNPGGEKISNAAWTSYYAHCNIGGIIRNITLFALPEHYIARTHIHTFLHADHAVVETCIEAAAKGKKAAAEISIQDKNGNTVAQKTVFLEKKIPEATENTYNFPPDEKWKKSHKKAFKNDEKYKGLFVATPNDFSADHAAKATLAIREPLLWDAEHPNLYALRVKLLINGKAQQENTYKIGIREITYGGRNGTAANKVYVNGKEIKLRGVCRHDVSHRYGRSLTKEEIYNEILTYKKNNINFIRTSHYPADDYMLEVCDELGMYVEQENAACFKGANNFEIYNAPQEFLQSFAEMIESARNHPSVIIWSLANESGFEKTYAFRAEYNYVKNVDTTRPVIFSYPHLVHSKPLPYDIKSKHYAKVTGPLGDKKAPLLHDEFAHVACYNISRLQSDNSVRDFWGESIRTGWNSIFRTDGALGCAIWAAIDDVFCIPAGTRERHQQHSEGPYAGYGEWGCIFDLFKREKPEAYLTKKAFTPVFVEESKTEFKENVILHVQNRFDHTDLNEVKMVVSDVTGILYNARITSRIAPHENGTIEFKNTGADRYRIQFYFGNILADTYLVAKGDANKGTEPEPAGTQDITECLELPGDTLICKRAKYKIVKYLTEDRINIKIIPKNNFALFADPNNCVLKLKLKQGVKSVSWERNAQYSVYPAGHIGRPAGTAYPLGTDNAYGIMPESPWEKDNENYFLYPQSRGKREISNDFMTRRNNIKKYTVSLENGKSIHIFSRDADINACVCRVENNQNDFELQITKGCYYPDLQWGNAFGKRFRRFSDMVIAFSLCCTNEPPNKSAADGNA